MNVLDVENEIPEAPVPFRIIPRGNYLLYYSRNIPMIVLSCGYQLFFEEQEGPMTPKRMKPRDRSKYFPHQGAKECARRKRNAA